MLSEGLTFGDYVLGVVAKRFALVAFSHKLELQLFLIILRSVQHYERKRGIFI